MQKLFATGVALATLMLCAGCGDSKSPTAPAAVNTGKLSVQAIQIGEPASSTPILVGDTRQLRATARLSDGSERDLTSLVSWSSTNPSAATVSTSGLVTAVEPGSGNIQASYTGTTSETPFTVVGRPTSDDPGGTRDGAGGSGGSSSGGSSAGGSSAGGSSPDGSSPNGSDSGAGAGPGGGAGSGSPGSGGTTLPPVVQSIEITGDHTVPVGRSVQLHAIAHMSDGTTRDVTGSANWQSENSILGSISQNGLLTGILPGSNVVTANYNGATASQPVQVTPF